MVPQVGIPQVKIIDCKISCFLYPKYSIQPQSLRLAAMENITVCGLYAAPGKIVMFKVSKAAQNTSQSKY